jgi:type III restriction enzyme
VNDLADQYGGQLINLARAEAGKWRDSGYASPVPTRVTKELLDFWFNNPERQLDKKLFFAQREAVETAVWFNEIAAKANAGQNILNKLK